MANYTTNYNLKKPLTSELFTVEDANGNMDLVDSALKGLEDNKVDGASLNASIIPFTPTGNLSSSNVQTALAELDSEKASKTQEAWIIPTLVNSWVERSPYTVSYFKDQFGMVILRGMVKDGVVGQWAFILPVGYRPSTDQIFIVNGGSFSNSFAKIIITTIGYVYVYISNLEVTLNNVQFRAV